MDMQVVGNVCFNVYPAQITEQTGHRKSKSKSTAERDALDRHNKALPGLRQRAEALAASQVPGYVTELTSGSLPTPRDSAQVRSIAAYSSCTWERHYKKHNIKWGRDKYEVWYVTTCDGRADFESVNYGSHKNCGCARSEYIPCIDHIPQENITVFRESSPGLSKSEAEAWANHQLFVASIPGGVGNALRCASCDNAATREQQHQCLSVQVAVEKPFEENFMTDMGFVAGLESAKTYLSQISETDPDWYLDGYYPGHEVCGAQMALNVADTLQDDCSPQARSLIHDIIAGVVSHPGYPAGRAWRPTANHTRGGAAWPLRALDEHFAGSPVRDTAIAHVAAEAELAARIWRQRGVDLCPEGETFIESFYRKLAMAHVYLQLDALKETIDKIPAPVVGRAELVAAVRRFVGVYSAWEAAFSSVLPPDVYAADRAHIFTEFWATMRLAVIDVEAVQSLVGQAGDRHDGIMDILKVGDRLERDVALTVIAGMQDNGEDLPIAAVSALQFVAYSVAAIYERLELYSDYHDLACGLLECGGKETALSVLWSLTAALDDRELLAARLGQISGPVGYPSQAHAPWLALFEGIRDASWQGNFSAALQTVLAQPDLRLAKILSDAQKRTSNYERTGFFDGYRTMRVLDSLRGESRDQLMAVVEDAASALSQRLTALDAEVDALLAEMLRLHSAAGAVAGLRSELSIVRAELQRLSNQRAAHIRADRVAAERSSLASLHEQFLAAADAMSPGHVFELSYPEGAPKARLSLSAQDAQYPAQGYFETRLLSYSPPSLPFQDPTIITTEVFVARPSPDMSVEAIAARTASSAIAADAGQILHVEARQGGWAPACILTLRNFAKKDELPALVTTGAEGYTITHGTSDIRVQSETESDGWSVFPQLFGIGVGASETHSDTTGTETRTSTVLSGGLFDPELAPIPEAPVGALVLVEMPRGMTQLSLRRRTHVPRGGVLDILVEDDADYYFVVNDVVHEACDSPRADTLGVTWKLLAAADEYAKKVLLPHMSSVFAALRKQHPQYIERGEVLPAEREALRSWANLQMLTASEIDVAEYPPELQTFFKATLDVELAALERAVAAENLLQAILLKAIRQNGLIEQIAWAENSASISTLLTERGLSHGYHGLVRDESETVVRLLRTEWLSVIRTWHNDAVANVALRDGETLQRFIENPMDHGGERLAAMVRDVASHAVFEYKDQKRFYQSFTSYVQVNVPAYPDTPPSETGYTLEPEAADAFWAAFLEGSSTTIRVSPEALYNDHRGLLLSCNHDLPVVLYSAVLLNNEGANVLDGTSLDNRIAASTGTEQRMMTTEGTVSFVYETESRGAFAMPVIGYDSAVQGAPAALAEFRTRFGETAFFGQEFGVSPIGSTVLDFSRVSDDVRNGPILGATLLFRVEARVSDAPVSVCARASAGYEDGDER